MSLAGRAFDSKCDFASPTILLGLFLCPCTYHQMVNTEIRLIILFAAKDGEGLYSQKKQDQELTVAQIKNYLFKKNHT